MNALLLGYYGAHNLGDDMMLHSLLPWLKKRQINVTVISENPAETTRRFNVNSIRNAPILGEWGWYEYWFRNKHALHLIRAIRGSDALIVGGGDLIRDDQGWRTFLYTIEKLIFAVLFKRSIYIVNIGISSPKTWYGNCVLKKLLLKCTQIIARDKRTYDVCIKLGCQKEKLHLLPDIALTIAADEKLTDDIDSKQNELHNKPYIVICLRNNPNAFGSYYFDDKMIGQLSCALDNIVKKLKMNIVFLPFQKGKTEDDNILHNMIALNISKKEAIDVREWTGNIRDVADCIKKSKLVIGMRLHSIVLAVAFKKPCIVMPYDMKVREFSRYFGLENILESKDLLDEVKITSCIERAINATTDYNLDMVEKWSSIPLVHT